jgi:hypothetical protein
MESDDFIVVVVVQQVLYYVAMYFFGNGARKESSNWSDVSFWQDISSLRICRILAPISDARCSCSLIEQDSVGITI